jgi:hypothetical protein
MPFSSYVVHLKGFSPLNEKISIKFKFLTLKMGKWIMGLSKVPKCLFPFVITSPLSPNKIFFFILVIQLMIKYHNIFHLIFQELWVHLKMCMDCDTKWNTNLKVPQRPKDVHLVFIILLLAFYNNAYYKYQSFFINFLINWS